MRFHSSTVLIILCVALMAGCASRRFQVAVLSSDGSISKTVSQDREGADMKALAINGAAHGLAVAWVQRAEKPKKRDAAAELLQMLQAMPVAPSGPAAAKGEIQ
jgi:hypothetical protein